MEREEARLERPGIPAGGKQAKTEAPLKPQLLGAGSGKHRWRRKPPTLPSHALSRKEAVWGHWPGAGWAGAPACPQNTRTHPEGVWRNRQNAAPTLGAPSRVWRSLGVPSLPLPRPHPVPGSRRRLAAQRSGLLSLSVGGGSRIRAEAENPEVHPKPRPLCRSALPG